MKNFQLFYLDPNAKRKQGTEPIFASGKADAAARIEEDGTHRPAAVRVKYEVLGGQLPFGFMGELQVSLAQSDEAGDADLQQQNLIKQRLLAEHLPPLQALTEFLCHFF